MGFFVTGNRGTLRGPPRCNAVDACMKLYNGMKGIGTDEAAITAVVSVHNSKQRQQIRKKYSQVYKKDLLKELDGELSFGFGKLVAALMMDPEDYTIDCIHKAVCQQSRGGKIVKRLSAMFKEGLGKTEYSILSLLFPRTNKQLEQIKAAFSAKYDLDLEERIAMGGNDLPQDLCTLLLDMLSGERDEEEEVDPDLVGEDTDGLIGASGCEDSFQEMMQERSFPHLRAVFDQYMEGTGKGIETLVEESEAFSLELKEAYKAMILLLTYEPEFYADRLRQAIQGAGTDDETLIRVIVLRSEVDMIDIVECYERKYEITLADDISGDTSGDYEDMLLKIIAIPEDEKKDKKGARRAGVKKAATKKAEEEKVELTSLTDVKQMRRVTRSKVVKKAATPSPTPPEEEDAGVGDEESAVEKKKVARKSNLKALKKAVLQPPEDEDAEVDEEESVVEKKKVARKAKSKAVKKAVSPPPEDEDAEVEEEEESVVETKKVTRKTKPKKKMAPPPEEEQQTEAEEDVEEEEKPVVQKKKAVKKVAKPKPVVKAAPPPKQEEEEEEEPEEEQEDEAVEEEVAAVVTKDVEAAVVVEPEEENAVEVEEGVDEVEEDNAEKEDGEDDTVVIETEEEETPEQDAKNEEVGEEPVVVVEEPEEESTPESTGNSTAKPGSEIEESASPLISREL